MAPFHKWTEYYEVAKTQLQPLMRERLDCFDRATYSLCNSTETLKQFLDENPMNFFVTRSTKTGIREVNFLHQAVSIEPRPGEEALVMALHGNGRGSATFKGLSTRQAVSPIDPLTRAGSRATTKKRGSPDTEPPPATIPSLE